MASDGASPKVKICVLQPCYDGSTSEIADLDTRRDLTQWLSPSHYEVEHAFVTRASAVKTIQTRDADVFVNLCDGAWDEDTPGADVVVCLERFKKAFTGAGSKYYDPTREDMKRIMVYWGIPTTPFIFAFNEVDLKRAGSVLRFPLFVKHYHSYNSVGITSESKVLTLEALLEQGHKMIERYGGALVEEFIEGREFSCLVAANPADPQCPLVFEPIECDFSSCPQTFKTFDFKWSGPKNPWKQITERELVKPIQDVTSRLFLACMNGSGYARTDVRMNANGELFVLEINPNPSLFYPDSDGGTADIILMRDGFGKEKFLKTAIEYGLQRQQQALRHYVVRHTPQKGHFMQATRAIAKGGLVYQLEERPHTLVSKARVESRWNALFTQWFSDFCYPLTDDLWVMWDLDPAEWKPINHSCDPNAWVDGLDLVARRDIALDEEITMDYATMYAGPLGPRFDCQCGAPGGTCRGKLTGNEYREAWFAERYGTHVTDFVRQKLKLLLPADKIEAALLP